MVDFGRCSLLIPRVYMLFIILPVYIVWASLLIVFVCYVFPVTLRKALTDGEFSTPGLCLNNCAILTVAFTHKVAPELCNTETN